MWVEHLAATMGKSWTLQNNSEIGDDVENWLPKKFLMATPTGRKRNDYEIHYHRYSSFGPGNV